MLPDAGPISREMPSMPRLGVTAPPDLSPLNVIARRVADGTRLRNTPPLLPVKPLARYTLGSNSSTEPPTALPDAVLASGEFTVIDCIVG